MIAKPLNWSLDPNTGPACILSRTYQNAKPSPKRSLVEPVTLNESCTSQLRTLQGTCTHILLQEVEPALTLFQMAPCLDRSSGVRRTEIKHSSLSIP